MKESWAGVEQLEMDMAEVLHVTTCRVTPPTFVDLEEVACQPSQEETPGVVTEKYKTESEKNAGVERTTWESGGRASCHFRCAGFSALSLFFG